MVFGERRLKTSAGCSGLDQSVRISIPSAFIEPAGNRQGIEFTGLLGAFPGRLAQKSL
jgi:hypothetical protein